MALGAVLTLQNIVVRSHPPRLAGFHRKPVTNLFRYVAKRSGNLNFWAWLTPKVGLRCGAEMLARGHFAPEVPVGSRAALRKPLGGRQRHSGALRYSSAVSVPWIEKSP